MKKFDILTTSTTREGHNNQMHFLGRCFTLAALILICLVPVAYCIAAGVMPDWKTLGACMSFVAGYWNKANENEGSPSKASSKEVHLVVVSLTSSRSC